jgi:CRISP-associated protein Cas1
VFADGQCCVKQDDREVRISIEDLAWAVIDTPQATLASALMAACMEAGVAIVLATRHPPSGLVLPFHRHHRQSVIARLQADAKDSLKKRLRQEKWFVARFSTSRRFWLQLAVMGQRR